MAELDGPDANTRELVVRLLTRAGMMMEDASAIAILSGGKGVALQEVVNHLEHASTCIRAIVEAARELLLSEKPLDG